MIAMKLRIIVGAVLAACTTASALAGTFALLPPQSGDMVPSLLLSRPALPAGTATTPASNHVHVERNPLNVSWALSNDAPLQAQPQAFARDSREYWMDVAASELQKGIQLPLSAPGAIIRLSSSDHLQGTLQPSSMHIQLGQQSLTVDHAANQLADTASLQAAGMAAPAASMVIRLKPELGAGIATLQAPAARGRYVVHVFEPGSPYTVTALADRDDLLLGNHVHVHVAMHDADQAVPLVAAGGFLRAPDGRTSLLDFQRQADGSFTVDAQPKAISSTPGLWEVHSFTVGTDANGQEVRRDTTTVFAAAIPDARLGGAGKITRAVDQGIDISLAVMAQNPSRYAVSAVLYGRGAKGVMVPAAYAQSAAWLPAGNGQLVLHYAPASLRGIGAPYELHDLRLQDQAAIGLLERRTLAIRFTAP
jgi:hypothetical protein